eukprot:TRINITY_DN43850_c0_g1_i1.p1 TRINITY_DN43850_c0_g1~~TRINITY_DN43850_c0_g1_i1.p1  ORF type:complete len:495 (-),score=59.06 TRINITY_DN43850_c0_g1_i1:115-1380(-)
MIDLGEIEHAYQAASEVKHAYFKLINNPIELLEAQAFNANWINGDPEALQAMIRQRIFALGAILEHRPDDTAARRTYERLELILAMLGMKRWQHYSPEFHPYKLFLESKGVRAAAGNVGEFRMPLRDLPLFEAFGFLTAREAGDISQMARDILPRFPPASICFHGVAHMRAVLAVANASAARRTSGRDFMPGTACLDPSHSAKLVGGSTPLLGKMPQILTIYDGEVPLLDEVARRIEDQFGLLRQNGQAFLLVNYDVGSHYMEHTDCTHRLGEHVQVPPQGDRWATVLISLNDDFEGGETDFPRLGLGFPPRVGRAIVWWNVDAATGQCDGRTAHVARPVREGKKRILMRWYEYFPAPGSVVRGAPPTLATHLHEAFRPGVLCDVNVFGDQPSEHSCRWYSTMSDDVFMLEGDAAQDAVYR